MKNQNFVVEVIKDEVNKMFVIRNFQGQVIKLCSDPVDIVTFFNEVEFKG